MQEVFEKIIEKLHKDARTLYSLDSFTPVGAWKREDAIEVVKEVAAEYNNGWIPCSDRIPTVDEYLKNDGRFIVTDGNRIYQSIFDRYDSMTFCDMGYDFANHVPYTEEDKSVIAWQPLPQPYEPKEG